MRLQFWKHRQTNVSFSLYIKCGAILLLFILSVLIVACGGSANDTSLGQPDVTVTINLGQSDGSPTPPLPEYSCSAWVTNTTPGINTTSTIGVYAKFVHNVNGNPEGVGQATAVATVLWFDGNSVNVTATTTSDGLAVFPVSIANRSADLNKFTMVTVRFSKPEVPDCVVDGDRAAFFTLVVATGTANAGGSPTVTSTPSPTVSPSTTTTPSPTPTPCPTPKKKCHR